MTHDARRLLDQFDLIRIVNLPHRTDRRAEMERELARVGLAGDPRVQFFPAFRPDNAGAFTSIGARGVYESQRAILREAAAAGQSVLILEDDCDFSAATATYRAPDDDWQIFYGGYEASDPADLASSDIVGAHMMGFRAAVLPRLVAFLNSDPTGDDGIRVPIDGAYVWFRRQNPDVVARFAEPPLGTQRPSRTDIAEPHALDRNPVTAPIMALARRAKRVLKGRS